MTEQSSLIRVPRSARCGLGRQTPLIQVPMSSIVPPGEGLLCSGSLGFVGTGRWIVPAPLISLGSDCRAFIRCCDLALGMFPSANNFY